ncbi:MAG TPA: VTT domain-containing protein [Casimicrobiaceae bacterium]
MTTLDWLSAAIASYGYVALLLATIVEGPIATVIGSFLASQGLLDGPLVYAIAVLGDLIGDALFYGAGRIGSLTSLFARSAFIERRRGQLARLATRFRTRPGGTLLFGKLTHAAGFLVLLAAGAARVPMTAFFGYNLLGTLPKAGVFFAIGYLAGAAYARVNSYLGLVSLVAFPLLCLALGIYFRRRLAFDQPES